MRSDRAGQDPLPFPAPVAAPREDDERRARPRETRTVVVLGGELSSTCGWPAGTQVVLDPLRRPQRADVAVVRERGALVAGVVDRQFGRPVLRNDHGVIWIGLGADVVGVVEVVAPVLDPPV